MLVGSGRRRLSRFLLGGNEGDQQQVVGRMQLLAQQSLQSALAMANQASNSSSAETAGPQPNFASKSPSRAHSHQAAAARSGALLMMP